MNKNNKRLKSFQNLITLDCEIVKAIPPPDDDDRIDHIEYCAGWGDFYNMGISCVVVHDLENNNTAAFTSDDLHELQHLINISQVVATFNGVNFDSKLLEANGVFIPDDKHYDLLREIWISKGLDPDIYNNDTHGGYGLDAIAKANGYEGKTGNGAEAPIWWQQAEFDKVISYCNNDVTLLDDLLFEIVHNGGLFDPTDGSFIKL